MKTKRILAILLTLAMLAAFIPASVLAAQGPVADYSIRLYGEEVSYDEGEISDNGLVFRVQINSKGYDVKSLSLVLRYDKSVLTPVDAEGYTSADAWVVAEKRALTGNSTFATSGSGIHDLGDSLGGLVVNLTTSNASALVKTEGDSYSTVASIYFAFNAGKTTADLKRSTVSLAQKSDLTLSSEEAEAQHKIVNGTLIQIGCDTDTPYFYGTINLGDTDNMTADQFSVAYDGIELPAAALKTLTLEADGSTDITVPTGNTAATASLKLTAEDEDGNSTTATGVTYTFYDAATNGNVWSKSGVSVASKADNSGATVSVAKSAAANLPNGDTTVYVEASKGDVKSGRVAVKITKTASTVTTVTTSTTASKLTIPLGDTSAKATVTAKVYDQYGVEMSGQAVTWTTNPATVTGVTVSNGVVTVDKTAQKGSFTLKATAGGVSSTETTFQLESPDLVVNTASAASVVLDNDNSGKTLAEAGVTADALTKGIVVTYDGKTVEGQWSFDDTQKLEEGNNTVTLTFTSGAKTATANVTVKVKANIPEYTVTYDPGELGVLVGEATEVVQEGMSPAAVPGVTPKTGYAFKGWSLDGKTRVELSTYEVTEDVTFTALYEKTDLEAYINGYTDKTFRPDGKATRAEIAKMLAVLHPEFDKDETYTSSLTDIPAEVSEKYWYVNYVNFGFEEKLINGYEDGSFKPEGQITRAEFAKMLACYLGLEEVSGDSFDDVKGHWAAGYIKALQDAEIVNGYTDNTFRPDEKLSRGEAVKMINLAVGLAYDEDADYNISFTDVTTAHWAYEYIIAAVNTDIKDIIE